VIAIMIITGAIGGVVNAALNSREKLLWRSWVFSVIVGIGAAMLIPLFLNTVSSNLLDIVIKDSNTKDMLVFGSFCLLAAISSKAFIQSLSDKILKEVQDARQYAEEAKQVAKEGVQTAKQAEEIAQVAKDSADYGLAAQLPQLKHTTVSALPEIQSGKNPEDPWAGQFGGNSETNNRRLEASIKPYPNRSDLALLKLVVRSTDVKEPLEGVVQFYLHPTFFENDKPIVPVINGKAELNTSIWGSFTVGAIADEGGTLLELDLSKNPDNFEPIKSR